MELHTLFFVEKQDSVHTNSLRLLPVAVNPHLSEHALSKQNFWIYRYPTNHYPNKHVVKGSDKINEG